MVKQERCSGKKYPMGDPGGQGSACSALRLAFIPADALERVSAGSRNRITKRLPGFPANEHSARLSSRVHERPIPKKSAAANLPWHFGAMQKVIQRLKSDVLQT
jgi:hypothetical protein